MFFYDLISIYNLSLFKLTPKADLIFNNCRLNKILSSNLLLLESISS